MAAPNLSSISQRSKPIDAQATDAAAVTPSDTNDLAMVATALYIGTQGDVVVITLVGGETVTFKAVVGWLPVIVTRVLATGTTASNIVAVWN